ncbi:MAG: argininosuccinate lyase [Ferruginibacter sp.]
MKLWQKNEDVNEAVENFTVGNDRQYDLLLAPFDILGSIAHVKMLGTVGIVNSSESKTLVAALQDIYDEVLLPGFKINDSFEDIHSQVEFMLTEKLGDSGKKIHAARSRNDQVLVDVKLYIRSSIEKLIKDIEILFSLLQQKSEQHKEDLLPGYTHLQLAMPSSFGLWFGAYAESLVDDVITLRAAYEVVNKNPLGSAAGYGSSFPINRKLTTQLLGFADLNYNVVYAQMGRGKAERITAQALSNVADTLARMSVDVCLYVNQHFNFISLPPAFTTGSSIMPHKKNPDVFELIRSYCNRIKALPNEIMMMTTNLPSGYHRDLQLLKEHLFPAFDTLQNCIKITILMLNKMEVHKDILKDEKYKYLFSVEVVNKLVSAGMPFREAYKKVGADIENGIFEFSGEINHVHEGSIGNLQNKEIKMLMEQELTAFNFPLTQDAIVKLLQREA